MRNIGCSRNCNFEFQFFHDLILSTKKGKVNFPSLVRGSNLDEFEKTEISFLGRQEVLASPFSFIKVAYPKALWPASPQI
jgi:hypothetical protein